MSTDLELLEIEIDTLWLKDGRNRLVKDLGPAARPAPHLVIATSGSATIVAIGSEVPEVLAGELQAAVTVEPPLTDPVVALTSLARCGQLLKNSLGPVESSSAVCHCAPAHGRRRRLPARRSRSASG